jgi:hypothetical protein
MIRYILLFIFPLITKAVVNDYPLSKNPVTERNCFYNYSERPSMPEIARNNAYAFQTDSLKNARSKAFVISSADSFPVQLGAFKNRSNAEKYLRTVIHLSEIKGTIIFKDGLYKIRATGIPNLKKSNAIKPEDSLPAVKSEQQLITETDTVNDAKVLPDSNLVLATNADTTATNYVTESADNSVISSGIYTPWQKRIKYFGESFSFVKALIFTILFSISTMITLLVIILLNRGRIEREEKLNAYLMEKYQSLIVEYLFGNSTHDSFRSIASDDYSRQVLIDQMIDVSVNLKGDESKRLLSLYKHLRLDKDSLARAHDHRWHKKIKGFRELAFMNVKDANDVIFKALNSSNEILRMEAQIALVRLSDKDHFDFLSHLRRPFSLWEQITLHDLMIQHNIPEPSFKKWLSSPNDTVVVFALRMIREFRQADAEEGIKESLLHKSPDVRCIAVQVAGDLGLRSTLDILKRMYKSQDYTTCLEIVKSMGKIPDTSMLGFLKLVLDKEDDVQLQIEATKSIEKMGEEGVKALVKIMKSEYKNYNIIVRHVLDRRIN